MQRIGYPAIRHRLRAAHSGDRPALYPGGGTARGALRRVVDRARRLAPPSSLLVRGERCARIHLSVDTVVRKYAAPSDPARPSGSHRTTPPPGRGLPPSGPPSKRVARVRSLRLRAVHGGLLRRAKAGDG